MRFNDPITDLRDGARPIGPGYPAHADPKIRASICIRR
jgi:hypothetical protein